MQELAPEMKKLQEKYKDDKQALVQAQMELYRKHGINPFGTCWLLLLADADLHGPVLRLAGEHPLPPGAASGRRGSTTWRRPDMLFCVGRSTSRGISQPARLRRLLLPGAVLQPAAGHRGGADDRAAEDDDAAADGRAAGDAAEDDEVHDGLHGPDVLQGGGGLCIYFIASSLWGFAERKLLPKFKPQGATGTHPQGEPYRWVPAKAVANGPATSTDVTRKPKRGRRRKKEAQGPLGSRPRRRGAPKMGAADEESKSASGPFPQLGPHTRQRLGDWWIEVLKQAEKK